MEKFTFGAPASRLRYLGLLTLALLIAGPQVFATLFSGLTSLIVAPFTGSVEFTSSRYEIFNAELLLIYVVVVLGLNLIFQAGMISLGHSAFFLFGAYGVGLLTIKADWSFWLAMPTAAVIAGLIGLVLGAPALRLGLFTLAMVTMGYGIVSEDMLLEWRSITGGGDGLAGVEKPAPFDSIESYYWLVVIVVVVVFLFTRNWLRSPIGRAGKATADNEVAAGSVGIDVRVVKLRAFVVSGTIAGLGGALYAPLIGFLSPGAFTVDLAVLFLLMVLLGGGGTVIGPIIGAFVLFRIPLAVEDITGEAGNVSLLVYGVVLIASVHLVPQGFMSAWWFLRARFGRSDDRAERIVQETSDDAAFESVLAQLPRPEDARQLDARGLRRRMGGVQAVDGVDLAVDTGQVHALIGPNGSGKTTTLNLLSGYVEPDQGTFELKGQPVAAAGHVRARAGLGRTFQTPLLFDGMSCVENVLVALDRHRQASNLAYLLRLPAARREERLHWRRACEILAAVGLHDPERRADVLPPGERRLLELARLVAARPSVVLMDEPAAGLTHAEIEHLERMVRVMASAGISVVLVEHHVDLVLRLADTVTVLDFGKVIAHGSPAEVREHPDVVAAYLGTSTASGTEGGVS